MKYKNKEVNTLTLSELEAADFELAAQEANFNKKMEHPKFEKFKPMPTISQAFVRLREEIKKEIEKEKQNG